MAELQFSIEQDLEHEDAIESMFDLLDFFEQEDNFDDIEWDEDEDIVFLANQDLEVEIALVEGYIDVFAVIHAPDLTKKKIRRNLVEDINKFFGLGRNPEHPSRRRNWREERTFERSTQRRERDDEEEAAPSRKRKPSRFGQHRPVGQTERRERSRGGAKRLQKKRAEKLDSGRKGPKVLPFSKKKAEPAPEPVVEEVSVVSEEVVEVQEPTPVVEVKDEPTAEAKTEEKSADPEGQSEASEPEEVEVQATEEIEETSEEASETSEEEVEVEAEPAVEEPTEDEEKLEAKKAEEAEEEEEEEEEEEVVKAKEEAPVVPEEEGGGGGWFLFFLLLLGVGFALFYMSPWGPGN